MNKIPFLNSSLSNVRPIYIWIRSSAAWFTFLLPRLFTRSVLFHQLACRFPTAGAIFSHRWQVKSPASPTDWASHRSNGRSFHQLAFFLPVFFSAFGTRGHRDTHASSSGASTKTTKVTLYRFILPQFIPSFFCSSHRTSDSPSTAVAIKQGLWLAVKRKQLGLYGNFAM